MRPNVSVSATLARGSACGGQFQLVLEARLVITAVLMEGRSQSQVPATTGYRRAEAVADAAGASLFG